HRPCLARKGEDPSASTTPMLEPVLNCNVIQAVIASITFYIVSLAATKISILLLYGRVFPKREFHAVLWGVGIFVAAFTIANVLFVIFSCRPIRAAWNPLVKGKCINTAAAILAVACLTTATDFIILGLPLPLVKRSQPHDLSQPPEERPVAPAKRSGIDGRGDTFLDPIDQRAKSATTVLSIDWSTIPTCLV
ncbi:MAG: hypothetical protein Q9224_006869, partial [Gallowayella concinna]